MSGSGRWLTQSWSTTGRGWIVLHKTVEMTICKLSYQFRRSLGNNDERNLEMKKRKAGSIFDPALNLSATLDRISSIQVKRRITCAQFTKKHSFLIYKFRRGVRVPVVVNLDLNDIILIRDQPENTEFCWLTGICFLHDDLRVFFIIRVRSCNKIN